MNSSSSHLVLVPSYNTGPKLLETLHEIRRYWFPVWVVIDGSTDGTGEDAARLAARDPGLRVLSIPQNGGKGEAVLHGLRAAAAQGFTHVLVMDADGQHPAALIPAFMSASAAAPDAVILGLPVFDATAPALRVAGRKLSNWCADLQTLRAGVGDSLFGFRIYPVQDLLAVMESSRWMRRFDFDPEVAVRLSWRGLRLINLPAPVQYFTAEEGGVSHFNYLRDNLLLTWMHTRLFLGFLRRLPMLAERRRRRSRG